MFVLAFITILSRAPSADAATPKCVLQLVNNTANIQVTQNGQITYSFTIKNNGRGTCAGTSVSAYYAPNESFISSNPAPSAHTNYYWQIGALAKGASYPLTVMTKNNFDGNSVVSNEACASANSAADSCAYTSTTIIPNTTTPTTLSVISTTTPPVTSTTTQSVASTTPSLVTTPTTATSTVPVALPVTATTTPVTSPTVTTNTKDYGVWFWDSPYALPWSQNKLLIDEAKANGFNAIYITIDDHLTLSSTNLQTYDATVQQFIAYANQNGIAVDAESGWRDWAETANWNEPDAIMDYVAQYNSTHSAKFRYVQYDIEPYLLPAYTTDPTTVLTDYVNLVNQLVTRDTYGLGIEMVVPYFYSSAIGWTPNITYGGTTGSTFTLVLSALDKLPNDSMIVMSYRNFASGTNGTIDISNDYMNEIGTGNHSTRMIIAQETGNVTPSYVTFYGMSKADLRGQIDIIDTAYHSNPAFQGTAIDYIDPFLQLQ